MQAVRINEVGVGVPVTTKFGNKLKFPVSVTELSMNKLYDVDVWANEGEIFMFSKGQEVTMEIKPGQVYNGKQQWSASYSKIALLRHNSEIEPPDPIEPVKVTEKPVSAPNKPIVDDSQKMWADKELRGYKGKSIMYAQEAMSKIYPENAWTEEEYFTALHLMAQRHLDWIYTV